MKYGLMRLLKLEVMPLPEFSQSADGLWFKLKSDGHFGWLPDAWQPPATEGHIQAVLEARELSSLDDRVRLLCETTGRSRYQCRRAIERRQWDSYDNKYARIAQADLERQLVEPTPCPSTSFWLYRNRLVRVVHGDEADELALRIKHKVLSHEKALDRLKREVEAFENFTRLQGTRRELIPEAVKLFVWQRDGGRCVSCGSQEHLEYDHIIPVARGGSSTERNVQLLCEACNRAKGARI